MADTSWIKPGKVAWDWWNFNNIYGVPFRAGVNTDTYKHYIDFAAENGIEYVILDEGWYKLGDLLSVVPEIDMDALAAHAKREERRASIMWVVWKTLDLQMDAGVRPVREVGREGHQGGLHAARGPVDGQLLRARGARRPRSAKCWWTSTARTSPRASTAPIRTSSPAKACSGSSRASGAKRRRPTTR